MGAFLYNVPCPAGLAQVHLREAAFEAAAGCEPAHM
jgi:hypothetical protein